MTEFTTPPAPDYATLLDPEVRAFIDRTSTFYPSDAARRTIAEQRAVYDGMCAAFDAPHPPGVATEDRLIGGVPCRVYAAAPSPVTVIHFHGGGSLSAGCTATTRSAPRSVPRPASASCRSITACRRNIPTPPPSMTRWR